MTYKLKCMQTVALLLLMIDADVQGNTTNYHQKIISIIERSKKVKTEQEALKLDQEFMDYVESLSSREILIAGKQYAEWAEKNTPSESWESLEGPMGTLYSILFFYSEKAGTEGLTPVIKIIQNKGENARWRQALIWWTGLDGFDGNLSHAEQWKLAKIFEALLRDEQDAPRVRSDACMQLADILGTMQWNALNDDPVVQKFRREKGTGVYELLDKDIELLPKTVQKLKAVQKVADQHIEFLLVLSRGDLLDSSLKDGITHALVIYRKTPLSKGKEKEIDSVLKDLRKAEGIGGIGVKSKYSTNSLTPQSGFN